MQKAHIWQAIADRRAWDSQSGGFRDPRTTTRCTASPSQSTKSALLAFGTTVHRRSGGSQARALRALRRRLQGRGQARLGDGRHWGRDVTTMAGMGGDCLSDAHCASVLVCYKNVSWAAELGFGSGSFCECDYWWGWQPSADGSDTCVAESAQANVLLASAALQLVLLLVVCFYAARGTMRRLRERPVVWNAGTTTLLFLDGAFFGLFLWRVAQLAITPSPERNTRFVKSSADDDFKTHQYVPLGKYALAQLLRSRLQSARINERAH